MKKYILLTVILLMLLLMISCDSNQDVSALQEEIYELEEEIERLKEELKDQENEYEIEESDQEPTMIDNGEIEAEITQEVLDVWEERDRIYVHFSLEIKNTGQKPIEIDWPTTVSLVGENNSILYSDDLEAFPDLLNPGEIAYAGGGTHLEHINNVDDVMGMEVNLNYSESFREQKNLQLEDLNYFIERSRIKITGRVVNTLDQDVDRVRMRIALFDKDGNLLGTVSGFPSGKIPSDGKLGFDISSLYLNVDAIEDKIDSIDGRVYMLR